MSGNQSIVKKIVLEFLDYLRFKIQNDTLTLEETENLSHLLEENLSLTGTIDDIAKFYGKSRENVKVVLSRKVLSKPKRCVLHSFNAFRKAVPDKWRRDGSSPSTHTFRSSIPPSPRQCSAAW
jgi:hypothetical protein